MSRPGLLCAVLCAGLAGLVLSNRVFVDLERIRVKLIRTAVTAGEGAVRVSLDDATRLARVTPPFALVARIRNDSGESRGFAIEIDGTRVCEDRIASGIHRLDCVVDRWPLVRQTLTIRGPNDRWAVESLELATHHGNTTGFFHAVILPAGATSYLRLPGSWTLAATVALGLVLLVPSSLPPVRWASAVHRTFAGTVATVAVLSLVSPFVSRYQIVLSIGTVIRLMLLILVSRLWFALRRLVRAEDVGERPWTAVARAAVTGGVVLAVFAQVMRSELRNLHQGNYSGFVLISERTFDDNPLLGDREDVRRSLKLDPGGGYDGQFMYFAAFDPLLRAFRDEPHKYRSVMDAPPYRFGRIGFSWLTHLLSGAEWRRYPATMIWLILSSLFAAGFLLALLAQREGLSPAWGGLILLIPGYWRSLLSALPEPVATAFLLGGLVSLFSARFRLAGLLLAVSLLVRETGLAAVCCALAAISLAGRIRGAAVAGALAIGALALWRVYVGLVLLPDWGLEAFLFHPPDFSWPFRGMFDLWRVVAAGDYFPGVPELSRAGVALSILISVGFLLAVRLAFTKPDAVSIAAVLYGLIAVSLNYKAIWVHVGNAQRGTYELFLMLALATLSRRSHPGWLRAALLGFWVSTAGYVLLCSLDATLIRQALQLPF